MRNLILLITVCGFFSMSTVMAADMAGTKIFYRYKNNQGITVMDSAIPPEYVNKGYEVVSRTGKVLKKIPPAIQGADAERLRAEKLLQEERARSDLQLRRSYSNVTDIDAAKLRNLESLRGNISILQANLAGVRTRLQTSQAQAAAIERSGRPLSEELLNTIKNTGDEEKDLLMQIKQRELEYQHVSDKFDEDRKRFIEITHAQ